MGWGVVAASRAKILGTAVLLDDPRWCTSTIVDVCSEARRMTGGPRPRTASNVAAAICTSMWKRTTHTLVFMYDDAERMHPQRDVLHAKRYRPMTAEKEAAERAKGRVIIQGSAYARGSEPYTDAEARSFTANSKIVWPRLWATTVGKACAFALVRKACIVWHQLNTDDESERVFVSWHRGKPTAYPYDSQRARDVAKACCSNTFGEADGKVAEAVKVLAPHGPVIIQTIDTDMILQVLASRTAHEWPTVHLRLLNETVALHTFVAARGGDSYERRLTATFWLLACNGVDYCRGLTRFGFNVDALAESASASPALFSVNDGEASFDAAAAMGVLCSLKRRRVKNRTWSEFNGEVSDMLFCLSLFSGAEPTKEPWGGPACAALVVCNLPGDEPFDSATLASSATHATMVVIGVGK